MQGVLDFIVEEIFGSASLFLGLIALFGLLLQKKSVTEVISGTVKTIVGVVILQRGVYILIGSISPLVGAFNAVYEVPVDQIFTPMGEVAFVGEYGTQIGLVMLFAFVINLIVARFTKLKNVFLTGHMLFWFPFIFIAVGIDAGMSGNGVLVFATIFTALYMIVAPAIIKPFVRKVIGNDSFTLGHPTIGLSLIAAYVARWTGNKDKSTEDIKFPKQLEFLREITITSSLVIFVVYLVMSLLLGSDAAEVLDIGSNVFMFALTQGILFGAGLTILLQGVRMMLAEIVPAFKGISDKVIPDAVPALDCPLIFPYAPNAVIIGFIVSMISSTIALILIGTTGMFSFIILPLTITCFFEIGTAAVFANAEGGLRGAIIGSAVAGIVMIFLMGFSLPFFQNTVADWMLIFGGNDFSIWGIISGSIARIFGG